MSTTYTLSAFGVVERNDGARIPAYPANTDWEAYQAWLAAGNTPSPAPTPAPPPPAPLSPRQFWTGLATTPSPSDPTKTIITQDESLAVVGGTIPQELAQLIAGLPAAQQYEARMKVLYASEFDIADPVTQAIAAGFGWNAAQLAAFWSAAGAL